MFIPRLPRFRDEKGQSAIELALIMPFFLFLIFLIVDFSKAFNYWNDANQISAVGARYAAVNRDPSGSNLQAWLLSQGTTKELREGGTDAVSAPAQVCITFPNGTSNVGDPVKVEVSFTYAWLPIVKKQGGLLPLPVSGSATMRLEAKPTNYSAGCA